MISINRRYKNNWIANKNKFFNFFISIKNWVVFEIKCCWTQTLIGVEEVVNYRLVEFFLSLNDRKKKITDSWHFYYQYKLICIIIYCNKSFNVVWDWVLIVQKHLEVKNKLNLSFSKTFSYSQTVIKTN